MVKPFDRLGEIKDHAFVRCCKARIVIAYRKHLVQRIDTVETEVLIIHVPVDQVVGFQSKLLDLLIGILERGRISAVDQDQGIVILESVFQ